MLIEYEREHGEYPPDLDADLTFHHCHESLDDYTWQGHRVRYAKPAPQGADQAVLYSWPPYRGGAAVFYFDLAGEKLGRQMEWVELDGQGNLRHPRTGAIMARDGQG